MGILSLMYPAFFTVWRTRTRLSSLAVPPYTLR